MRVPQRGRALVRRLSPHETMRAFRPGDFLLTVSDGGLARLQGWATAADINHAAIIVDPLGAVVEANPLLIGYPRSVRMSSVAEYARAGKPCWIGYVELREGTRQDVVAFVEHLAHAQAHVSPFGRLCLALHTALCVAPRALSAHVARLRPVAAFLDRHALTFRAEHSYASGELVARALERGGFIWDRDPAHITPRDLFERFHFADEPAAPRPTSLAAERGKRRKPPSHPTSGRQAAAISRFVPLS
ncbi:MAG: hypothetical protein ACRDHE_13330 [Ktedonobacterales bacterium]